MQSFFYPSPIGVLEIKIQNHRLYAISSAKLRGPGTTSSLKKETPATSLGPQWANKVSLFLRAYFAGQMVKNIYPPLILRGSAFQQTVWRYLQTIPYGETRSYSELAQAIGAPGAQRAVGSACAQNPFLILVPCHRVVAQNGLGGFALGFFAKQFLLKHEQKFILSK